MIWNEAMECADRETMRTLQLEKLKKTVKYEYDHVPYYKKKLDDAGVAPEDIQSLEDIGKLPFMEKEDLAINYPTGLFARPKKDIIDSGNTLNFVMNYLMTKGANSVKVCTLCDKPSRRKVPLVPDYCGAEIPDEFIVGYGLDYAEKYRNLPYIGILKRSVYE